LMAELLVPAGGAHVPVRIEIGQARKCNTFELAFPPEDSPNIGRGFERFRTAIEVDHVIQVPGARPFLEGSNLFGENFRVGITLDAYSAFRTVRESVPHRHQDRGVYHDFIRRKIKPDFRHRMFAGIRRRAFVVSLGSLRSQGERGRDEKPPARNQPIALKRRVKLRVSFAQSRFADAHKQILVSEKSFGKKTQPLENRGVAETAGVIDKLLRVEVRTCSIMFEAVEYMLNPAASPRDIGSD